MTQTLSATRRQLRRQLIPGAESTDADHTEDNNHFPRSKVMRFAFNPRNQRLLMLSGSVLAVVATRLVGASRMSLVTDIARSFTRNNKS